MSELDHSPFEDDQIEKYSVWWTLEVFKTLSVVLFGCLVLAVI